MSQFAGCISFVESTGESSDYVLISDDGCGVPGLSGSSCFSHLGRMRLGRPQCLNLDQTCLNNKTIVHELLHTLGMWVLSRYMKLCK